ncbi:MAG TPA: RNA-binding protein [Bacteroidales bacterium]|nr:RNA-binding protein [Bacteroidales bacterium]HOK74373.1 RNA-binding protein [Bacteroidales bacterium]HOM41776.1 RNA-binding protein [Bacteroidales bacterium]HOU30976.1 RNA-binding protein [Bacteroidales bacterium]HPP92091.1 RNA-binding protein [Bacteroidales bacterium]
MNIFVARLSSKTRSEDLERLFSKFGEVTSSKVIVDKQTGFSKRYGFVEMPDEQAAYEAIEKLNNTELDGSQIVVKMSVPTHRKKTRRRRNEPGNAK